MMATTCPLHMTEKGPLLVRDTRSSQSDTGVCVYVYVYEYVYVYVYVYVPDLL